MRIIPVVVCCSVLLLPAAAIAADSTTSATMHVSLEVVKSCTLKANDLVEVEPIMDISSRLVVNQASLKLKQRTLRPILDAFAQAVAAKNP